MRALEALFARVSRGRAKPVVAWLLRRPPGSWALRAAHRWLSTSQPIGVLAVVLDEAGCVLLVDHVTRASYSLGLPGGWLDRGERPEDGLRRELEEELGLEVTGTHYLLSAPHRDGKRKPYGLTIVYRAETTGGISTQASPEVLSVTWLSVTDALPRLRGFEAEAVRFAASSRA